MTIREEGADPVQGAAPRMSPSEASRLGWVDVAKGICILMVVAMHSTLGVEKATGQASWMGTLVEFARPFRMPDFFLISGLFLSRVIDRDWRRFLDRRVVHFLYFYLLWLTIQFLFKAPGMAMEEGVGGAVREYLLAIFIEPFGTLWFIWMLPVFALVVRLTRRVPVPLMLLAGAALEIADVATGHVAIDEFAGRFVYFYAGYALARHVFGFARWTGAHRRIVLLLLVLWALVEAVLVFSGWADVPGFSLALGGAGALAVVAGATLLVGRRWAGEGLRFLGEHSIVVYLAFFLPMAAMRTLLLQTNVLPDVALMALVTTVFAVFFSLAIWWASRRFGLHFLFERPSWARIDGARPVSAEAPLERSA